MFVSKKPQTNQAKTKPTTLRIFFIIFEFINSERVWKITLYDITLYNIVRSTYM